MPLISSAGNVVANFLQKKDTKNTLDDTIDFLKGIAPDCDYISVSFGTRKKNRWAECDGLEKAKIICSGVEGTGFRRG